MKVLFDHNIPKRLRRLITNHDVRTAREMGWAELENGELMTAAELAGFDVMLTGDKNIRYQQNLKGRQLALISLSTNDWNVIKQNPQPVLEAIDRTTPGSFQNVSFERIEQR